VTHHRAACNVCCVVLTIRLR